MCARDSYYPPWLCSSFSFPVYFFTRLDCVSHSTLRYILIPTLIVSNKYMSFTSLIVYSIFVWFPLRYIFCVLFFQFDTRLDCVFHFPFRYMWTPSGVLPVWGQSGIEQPAKQNKRFWSLLENQEAAPCQGGLKLQMFDLFIVILATLYWRVCALNL